MRGILRVATCLIACAAFALAASAPAIAGSNPKLKDLKVRLEGSKPGPSYSVRVKARLRACSSKGPIRIEIEEQKTGFDHPPTVVAQNTRDFSRPHKSPCQLYKVSWNLSMEFFGIGVYKVRAHVTDSDGDRSRSLVESIKTTE